MTSNCYSSKANYAIRRQLSSILIWHINGHSWPGGADCAPATDGQDPTLAVCREWPLRGKRNRKLFKNEYWALTKSQWFVKRIFDSATRAFSDPFGKVRLPPR
jgi:hypothetical protein